MSTSLDSPGSSATLAKAFNSLLGLLNCDVSDCTYSWITSLPARGPLLCTVTVTSNVSPAFISVLFIRRPVYSNVVYERPNPKGEESFNFLFVVVTITAKQPFAVIHFVGLT